MKNPVWPKLGFDYFLFGAAPPENSPKSFYKGYADGKRTVGKPEAKLDFFASKWLALRFQAALEDRDFEQDVNSEFLSSIVPDVCPVTGVSFTGDGLEHSELCFHRILASEAYATWNLVCISPQGRLAMASRTFEDVCEQVALGNDCDNLLTPIQWKSLLSLIYSTHMVAGLVPASFKEHVQLHTRYPDHLFASLSISLQMLFCFVATHRAHHGTSSSVARKEKRQEWLEEAEAVSNPAGLKIISKMLKVLEQEALTVTLPTMLMSNPVAFDLYTQWRDTNPNLRNMRDFIFCNALFIEMDWMDSFKVKQPSETFLSSPQIH